MYVCVCELDGQMDEWDGWMNGWTNEWIDEWING